MQIPFYYNGGNCGAVKKCIIACYKNSAPWKPPRSSWVGLWETRCSCRCPCSLQRIWTRWPLTWWPSNLNYPMILWLLEEPFWINMYFWATVVNGTILLVFFIFIHHKRQHGTVVSRENRLDFNFSVAEGIVRSCFSTSTYLICYIFINLAGAGRRGKKNQSKYINSIYIFTCIYNQDLLHKISTVT